MVSWGTSVEMLNFLAQKIYFRLNDKQFAAADRNTLHFLEVINMAVCPEGLNEPGCTFVTQENIMNLH